MQFLSKAADFMLISLMFVIFSLPVLTIGPSATAMYSVFIKRANGYEGSVISAFWKAFCENFKNAVIAELLLLPMLLVSGLLIYWVYLGAADNSLIMMIVCFLPGVLMLFALNYVFPLIAQFENTPQHTVKNAFILSIGHLPTSAAVTIINLVPMILAYVNIESFLKILPYFTLLGFGLTGWIDEKLLRRVFRQFFPKVQKEDN